jgi:GAF domain-containing protein
VNAKPNEQLLQTLVTLADTLVDDYDIVDLLGQLVARSAELLGSSAAGILLQNDRDELEIIAASDERTSIVELIQLSSGTGPCVECYRSGRVVSLADIESETDAWPEFRAAALEQGFHSLHAVPLRLRNETIGALNLFQNGKGALGEEDVIAAQTLADIATIAILHERALRESGIAREQLQRALDSRVVIEQAKGVIAYRRNVSIDEAFELLRGHARAQRLGIGLVARDVVDRLLEL